jgi:hypothetical protein
MLVVMKTRRKRRKEAPAQQDVIWRILSGGVSVREMADETEIQALKGTALALATGLTIERENATEASVERGGVSAEEG